MNNKSESIEQQILNNYEKGLDATLLLRQKMRILKNSYDNLTELVRTADLTAVAPIYAQRLACLNNIKNLQIQIHEDLKDTENEINKIYEQMRENGFGWILDNLPKKK